MDGRSCVSISPVCRVLVGGKECWNFLVRVVEENGFEHAMFLSESSVRRKFGSMVSVWMGANEEEVSVAEERIELMVFLVFFFFFFFCHFCGFLFVDLLF